MMTATDTYLSTCSLLGTPPAIPPDNAMTLQDQRIRQAQNGNLEAFNELVLTYQDLVFRQALWLLNDEAAAEDASQESFLRAYRNIHTLKGSSFRPWLLKITTNYCLDHIRSAKRHPCQTLDLIGEDGEEYEPSWFKDPGDTPEAAYERSEIGDRIAYAIQRLAPEYRMTVVLVDLEGLDYLEASAILHIPLGTFKSRLARTRRKLRDDLASLSMRCFSGR